MSIEWIDIGTWQLPSGLILEKHKQAWDLSRENAKNRSKLERSKRRHEVAEIAELVDHVIIRNYEKTSAPRKLSEKEIEKYLHRRPRVFGRLPPTASTAGRPEKNPKIIALEILKAFRKEMNAGKALIENENKPPEEKQADLARIEKAIQNISHLTDLWVKKP